MPPAMIVSWPDSASTVLPDTGASRMPEPRSRTAASNGASVSGGTVLMSTSTPPVGAGDQPVRPVPGRAHRVAVGEHRDRDVRAGRCLGRGARHGCAELVRQRPRRVRRPVVERQVRPTARDGARHRRSHPPGADDGDLHRVASSVVAIVEAMRSADGICASSRIGFAASGTCGVVIRTTGPSSE